MAFYEAAKSSMHSVRQQPDMHYCNANAEPFTKHQTFLPFFGDPCPLCFRSEEEFSAPPSCMGLCLEMSRFAGETSRGLPDFFGCY